MNGRDTTLLSKLSLLKNTTTEESKKDLSICEHYDKAFHLNHLTNLKNQLDAYLKKYPPVTTYATINTLMSWVPGLSKVGIRTNQPYAGQASQILTYALFHLTYTPKSPYYILTTLEKLLWLYNNHSSTDVSSYIKEAFKKILNVELPLNTGVFLKIKRTILEEYQEEDCEPEFKKNLKDIFNSSSSKMSLEEYLQAQSTWQAIQLLSGQSETNIIPLESASERKSEFKS